MRSWWRKSGAGGSASAEDTFDESAVGVEPMSELEQQNPLFRWLTHLGIPISSSLLIHMLLMGAAGLYVFTTVTTPTEREYSATVTNALAAQMRNAFQWGQEDVLQPLSPQDDVLESLDDLKTIGALDLSQMESSDTLSNMMTTGSGTMADLGVGEGRLSVLGTGGGAAASGEGGLGGGFGGAGRSVGRAGMWGKFVVANSIVYVVDFSGSIIVAVDDLRRELKRSISGLRESQAFNVIVFYSIGDNFKSESFASRLQPATPDVRERFFEWIDRKSPDGSTQPLSSVKRGLRMRPEAIFFFSDGYFDDRVVDEIQDANRGKSKIYCFVFDELLLQHMSDLPPRLTDGARRLARIAEDNGGSSMVVTGGHLRRR